MAASYSQQEVGLDHYLLEDGSGALLLESQPDGDGYGFAFMIGPNMFAQPADSVSLALLQAVMVANGAPILAVDSNNNRIQMT